MARQLALTTPAEGDWRLDERTKELGQRGVCSARAALRRAAATAPASLGAHRRP